MNHFVARGKDADGKVVAFLDRDGTPTTDFEDARVFPDCMSALYFLEANKTFFTVKDVKLKWEAGMVWPPL